MTCRSSVYLYTAICEYVNVINTTPRTQDSCTIRRYEIYDIEQRLQTDTYFIDVIQEFSSSGYPSGKIRSTAFRYATKRGWEHSWLVVEILRHAELWIQHTT